MQTTSVPNNFFRFPNEIHNKLQQLGATEIGEIAQQDAKKDPAGITAWISRRPSCGAARRLIEAR
jgi:hypothetical protein